MVGIVKFLQSHKNISTMNALIVTVFACLAVFASAKPSGIWGGYGHGHGHGHLPVVGASGVVSSGGAAGPTGVVNGHGAIGPNGEANAQGHGGLWVGGGHGGDWNDGDDGQWHGEGLLASQDWGGHGGHGAAIVAPAAAAIIAPGIGLGHGIGGIGLGGIGLGHGIGGIGLGHGIGLGIHGHGW